MNFRNVVIASIVIIAFVIVAARVNATSQKISTRRDTINAIVNDIR